jgi:hypothetical protein
MRKEVGGVPYLDSKVRNTSPHDQLDVLDVGSRAEEHLMIRNALIYAERGEMV